MVWQQVCWHSCRRMLNWPIASPGYLYRNHFLFFFFKVFVTTGISSHTHMESSFKKLFNTDSKWGSFPRKFQLFEPKAVKITKCTGLRKNPSSLPSFRCVTRVFISGVNGILGKRSNGWNWACGNEAVDSQHGTGRGGSSHPCTKGYRTFSICFLLPHTC